MIPNFFLPVGLSWPRPLDVPYWAQEPCAAVGCNQAYDSQKPWSDFGTDLGPIMRKEAEGI